VVLLVTGWLAAGLLATLVGTAAIDSLGAGLFDEPGADGAIGADEVRRRLAADASVFPTAPAPMPPASTVAPGTGPAPVSTAVPTPGGTVYATCTGDTVLLNAYNPAAGFEVDDPAPGPAVSASVTFKRGRGSGMSEITVVVTCRDGAPDPRVRTDD